MAKLTIGLVLLILVSITHFSHTRVFQLTEASKVKHASTLVPSYESLRLVSLGFDKLLADCYWLAFITYFGDTEERAKDHFALADRYLDLITSLDPEFVQPYWFAAFAVGSEQKKPKRAAQILDKGIEANKDNWYLPFIAGFNQYMYAKDELAAARYYRMASKYPDAPEWLGRQAKILEAKIPSLVKEVNTWSNVYYSVKDKDLKLRAKTRLQNLWVDIYKKAPSQQIREKAIKALKDLGIEPASVLEN